ncbi:MAG: TorF family putative porin [Gammaproteobacteria bacterium]
MTSLRTVRHSLLAATVAGAAVVSIPAAAEVSANAAVANVYLWRGLDLGAGVPAVSGGLDYGHESGLYAGVWGSSSGPTQEVDFYAGWAKEFDGFSV